MSAVDPQTRLEQTYRRLLWLLPPAYRRARGRELIDVLMEQADPEQRRPSRAESGALLRLSVRRWASRMISSTPASARDAMGLLAVLLPMLLLFPAVTALLIDAAVGGVSMSRLPFGADIPAWLLWCLTALLCVVGRPSWARWSATLGVGAFSAALVFQYADNNFQVVANALGWLGVQVVAAIALASPSRVARGRSQVPRWWVGVIGVGAAGAGLAVSTDQFRPSIVSVSWVAAGAAVLVVVLAVVALFSAAGRAVLPIGASLIAFMLATKLLANRVGDNMTGQSGPRSHIDVSDVVLLAAAPLLGFVVVRAVTAGANALFPTGRVPVHGVDL